MLGRDQEAARLLPDAARRIAVRYGFRRWPALVLLREALRQRGDFVGAHRVLTAASAMAGQIDAANSALQDLRRAQPNISLAWISANMPIRHAAEREHYVEAFRKAGLG